MKTITKTKGRNGNTFELTKSALRGRLRHVELQVQARYLCDFATLQTPTTPVRSLVAFRLNSTHEDYCVVGTDAGKVTILASLP